MIPLIAKLVPILAKAKPRHEELEGGHERFWLLGVPVFDSRRVERRLANRLKRIEVRKARRAARKARREKRAERAASG